MENNLHKEVLNMCIEAKERGCFKPEWNPEKDLWIKDIQEIIVELHKHLEKKDIAWILADCRYIADTSMIEEMQLTHAQREEITQYKEDQYYNSLT